MGRELTRTEKAAIRRLVSKWCANYDRDCGCLPLDCECYMFGKCWTGAYCRYFREAVLPLDPALEAALLAGQIALDEQGYLIADETTRTSVAGVFAVGDVRTKAVRQIVTAASDGAVAAHFAEEYLNSIT